MKKATMFVVGILMIAMLVGFGATAAAPADPYDEWEIEKKGVGVFLEDDHDDDGPVHCPWGDEYLVLGSKGGAHWCCGCCPGCVEPNTRY